MKNRLRQPRTEHGWSQAVLGARLDVSRQTINAIEAGRYDPSLPLAFRIARLFNRAIEDIFDHEAETEIGARSDIGNVRAKSSGPGVNQFL